jgi:opacity protein-like surface antigen
LRAQVNLGLQAGVSLNSLHTNIADRPHTSIHSREGYTAGLLFQYALPHGVFVEASPGLVQKNYSIDRTDSFAGVYQSSTNTYIQLPVMLYYAYGGRFKALAGLGVAGSYWLAGSVKGTTPDIFSATGVTGPNGTTEDILLRSYAEKYTFDARRDQRWEFGWLAGAGVQYSFYHSYTVLLRCLYYQSLTDQQKHYMTHQVPQYNRTLLFSLGITRRL